MTYIGPVGQNNAAPFLAFGDDSQFEDKLAYAFLIVPRKDLQRMHRRLFLLKERFKIPAKTPIHCRVLLHTHAREKAGLGHITDHAARAVIGHVIRDINRLKCGVRYSHTTLPAEKPVQHPREEGMHQMPFEPKLVLGVLAQACFAVAEDGSQGPLARQCEIVVAEDRTLISTGSVKRSQAHQSTSGWSNIGSANQSDLYRIQPRVSTSTDEPMLEIADILAYTCSHALRAGRNQDFFAEQLGRLTLWTASELSVDFEPGPWQNAAS